MAGQASVAEVDLRRLGEPFADVRVIRLEPEDNVARIEDGEPQVGGGANRSFALHQKHSKPTGRGGVFEESTHRFDLKGTREPAAETGLTTGNRRHLP